jgi:hypothetical protein
MPSAGVTIPDVTLTFGSVTVLSEDILEVRVHHGGTREVSSFEVLINNIDGKYYPGDVDLYGLRVAYSASIKVGRVGAVPQLLTGKVETLVCEGEELDHRLHLAGRCKGERLFRRNVTKNYGTLNEEKASEPSYSHQNTSYTLAATLSYDTPASHRTWLKQIACVVKMSAGEGYYRFTVTREGESETIVKDDGWFNNTDYKQVYLDLDFLGNVSGDVTIKFYTRTTDGANTVYSAGHRTFADYRVKGDYIVKDLINNYTSLGHNRSGTELIEETDTTFSRLEYVDTPLQDILRYIAESSDYYGVIGYEFRIAPDGLFEFFPHGTKWASVGVIGLIETYTLKQDISRVRNKITIKGAPDKSVPLNKSDWTENLTPGDGAWTSNTGTVSFDTTTKMKGSGSIKLALQNQYYGDLLFTLNSGKEVNANNYPKFVVFIARETTFQETGNVILYDGSLKVASMDIHITKVGEWEQIQFEVGEKHTDGWIIEKGFDWTTIKIVRISLDFTTPNTGNMWVDGMYFGGCNFSATVEDIDSQDLWTDGEPREYVDTDEELQSDFECYLRALAILATLKDPAENVTVTTTVLEYGNTPILTQDKTHIELPTKLIDGDYTVLSADYYANLQTQTLEVTLKLGKEIPQLADYMYAVQSRIKHLVRYKRT